MRAKQILLFIVSMLLAWSHALAQEAGKITLLPNSSNPTELQGGRTYTSADNDVIKSGSLTVSEDGTTLYFNNLVMKCELTESEGNLFYTVMDRFSEAEPKKWAIVLEGNNDLQTKGYYGISSNAVDLTISGSGRLTVESNYIDIDWYGDEPNGELVIDNTTVTCLGYIAIEDYSNILVKNSYLEGRVLSHVGNLTMEGCSIRVPYNGCFDSEAERYNIKDTSGNIANHFVIARPDDNLINRQLIVNGDFEGADFSSFAFKYSNAVQAVTAIDIVDEDGNHCLKAVSQANAGNPWDSQLLINLPRSTMLSSGSIVKFSMRVKASRTTTLKRSYYDPEIYDNAFFEDMFGEVNVSTEWTTISGYYTVPYWLNGTERDLGNENTVILDLNCDEEHAIVFYFDDISLTPIFPDEIKASDFTFSKQTLLRDKTYTKDDLNEIKSGSFYISEDGGVLTFDNLNIETNGYTFQSNRPLKLVLKGDNSITTSKYAVMDVGYCQNLTITGDGSLTTKAQYYDFFIGGCDVLIDHTTLNCKSGWSFANDMTPTDKIIVNHSTLKGEAFFRIASLTLINSEFVSPKDVVFAPKDTEGTQLYTPAGEQVYGFEIQPVEGDFTHRVRPWSFDNVIIAKGETKDVTFSMKNEGIEEVREIAYVVSVGGIASQEKTISLNQPYTQTGDDFTVTIPIEAADVAASKELTVTVTKVNGQENTSPGKTVRGVLCTISEVVGKRVVVEEFTGTWCGNCTRGTLTLELLNKEYGNNIITIAVHNDDPMETSSYKQGAFSFPSARVNRGELTDPYYGNSTEALGIKALIEEEQNIAALAGIEASAAWTTDGQSAIRVETKTTFVIDDDASHYGIGLALLQDGMKGTGRDWAQVNYYSGESADGDPYLSSITALPSLITNIEYHHVAVDAWDIDSGIDGSVKGIQTNVPQTFTYVCDISGNKLIQDKSKLKVVALLIDKRTGKICNAAQTAILDASTGIADVKAADSERTVYYTIDGQRVSQPQKGVNIIRTSDGQIRKVLTK